MSSLFAATLEQLRNGGVDVDLSGDGNGSFGVDAEPLPWRVHFFVRDEKQLVIHGVVPTPAPADRRAALAEFVTRANFGLVIGNFEFDIDTGELRYKTSLQTVDGSVDPALIGPLFSTNIATTAEYLPGILGVVGGDDPTVAIAAVESRT